MRLLILLALATVSLAAQSISPSTASLLPGESRQFKLLMADGSEATGSILWFLTSSALGKIDTKGSYTAPATVDTATKVGIAAWTFTPKFISAQITITVTPKPLEPIIAVAYPGDVFVMSSGSTAPLVFTRTGDLIWESSASVPEFLIAMFQVYRNNKIQGKQDVDVKWAPVTGKVTLTTAAPWQSTDVVSATWVKVNK